MDIGDLKIKYHGRVIKIKPSEILSIDQNLLDSSLKDSPSSYYFICTLRDYYISKRDKLAKEKDQAYSTAWTYYKDTNERWNNDYVTHKANQNHKYISLYDKYIKVCEKTNMLISLCKAFESRENILRTLSANQRKLM